MLLDVPTQFAAEVQATYTAWNNAANGTPPASASTIAFYLKLLNKALDKCSVELGRPNTPRPTVVPQEDGTLMLQYPA
jgi:hypothetical protein